MTHCALRLFVLNLWEYCAIPNYVEKYPFTRLKGRSLLRLEPSITKGGRLFGKTYSFPFLFTRSIIHPKILYGGEKND